MLDQPPPPLPPFSFTSKSLEGTLKGVVWNDFVFTWGDLKLTSDQASYSLTEKLLRVQGRVRAQLGGEWVEGKALEVRGLDALTRSLDRSGFGFYFSDARLFSPLVHLASQELRFSSETGAEARRLYFVPGPGPHGELELSAARVRSLPESGRLAFEDATVRLFGNRLITLPRLSLTPHYDKTAQTQSLALPILYRTSRVSGVAAGVRLPFAPVGGTPGTFVVESTSRQGWNALVTLRRELLGVPRSGQPVTSTLLSGLRNATQKERSFEERVRPFITARAQPGLDLSVRRYTTDLSTPATLEPLPRQQAPSLALEATAESNREFVRRSAFLLRSRLPELRLVGRMPGPSGYGGWVATVGGGPAREERLDGSEQTIRSDRFVATLGWEAPRRQLGTRGQAHLFVGQTEQHYPGKHYSISELRLSADYGLSVQSGLSAGLALRRAQGKSPFLFDTLEAVDEAQLRGQTQLGSMTVALVGRWDLRSHQLFDQEFALGWRGKTIEPKVSWRSQNRQFGFTLTLPALAGF